MKKIILLLFISLGYFQSNAQVYGFETWQNFSVWLTQLERPTGWACTDSLIVGFGKPTNLTGTYIVNVLKCQVVLVHGLCK
jgi:hypothetical protein